MEAKITMELWEWNPGGVILRLRVDHIYSKKRGVWSPTFARFFFLSYAFERMNTSKMIEIESRGGGGGGSLFFMYHVLNDYKCGDSNDRAFVV